MIKKFISNLLFTKIHKFKLTNDVPEEAHRCIFVFAPHTSNWDWYFGTLAMYSWGLPMKVAIKRFWTKFPLGLVIKPLGGVAIDRKLGIKGKKASQVDKLASLFESYEKISFVITPEGTRNLRTQWKTGFYHIAKKAQVPIVLLLTDFPQRIVRFGPVLNPNKLSLEETMYQVGQFYKEGVAVYPDQFSIDQRYL